MFLGVRNLMEELATGIHFLGGINMKAYTGRYQSKKLAEILPLDSADMSYTLDFDSGMYRISTTSYKGWIVPKYAESYKGLAQVIPCWSLAALLKELPETMLGKDNDGYVVMVETMGSGLTTFASNPVDACYEMIIKLKERKLL